MQIIEGPGFYIDSSRAGRVQNTSSSVQFRSVQWPPSTVLTVRTLRSLPELGRELPVATTATGAVRTEFSELSTYVHCELVCTVQLGR
jgi:hypothetical protein